MIICAERAATDQNGSGEKSHDIGRVQDRRSSTHHSQPFALARARDLGLLTRRARVIPRRRLYVNVASRDGTVNRGPVLRARRYGSGSEVDIALYWRLPGPGKTSRRWTAFSGARFDARQAGRRASRRRRNLQANDDREGRGELPRDVQRAVDRKSAPSGPASAERAYRVRR